VAIKPRGDHNLSNNLSAEIGIFGGSAFYKLLLDNVQELSIETPYGAPSDKVVIGTLGGKQVAFLPRHGKEHHLPPHKINYRANVWAMKSLGVSRIISPCAAGSLQKHVAPGHFVICDQYVDRTTGRPDTFYDGPTTTHVSAADPYCPELRKLAVQSAEDLGITTHSQGTVVVIQGPRFSTKAESKWFTSMGWEVINMTQYPEAHLARELELCVVNISLITDYDSGLVEDVEPVSHQEVVKVFNQNMEKFQKMLVKLLTVIPSGRANCSCARVLANAAIH
jgi:5'-methylthioadenosine phosphorylase